MSTQRERASITCHPDTLQLADRMRAYALLTGQHPDATFGNAIDMAFMFWAVCTRQIDHDVMAKYVTEMAEWGIYIPPIDWQPEVEAS